MKIKKLIVLPVVLTTILFAIAAKAGNNLVGWHKFDENNGDTAHDSSGYGYDGILVGPIWAPAQGRFKGAVSFNGSSNCYVEIPTTGLIPTSGTIALWMNLSQTQSGNRYLLGHTSRPPGFADRIQLYMNKGDTQLDLGLGDIHCIQGNIVTMDVGIWYHIALTWDKNNYAVFVNGERKAAGIFDALNALGSYIDIGNNGRHSSKKTETFNGFIDDVAIFNQSLDPNEIDKLYHTGIASFALEPNMQQLIKTVQEAGRLYKANKNSDAVELIEKTIAEYSQWEDKNPDVEPAYKLLISDLYVLLAKAREATGYPKEGIIAAYKQIASRPLRWTYYASTFLWLFENTSSEDYIATVKQYVRNNNITPATIYRISKDFEASKNWTAFKLFIEAVFSEVDTPAIYAKAINKSFQKNNEWAQTFWEYCRDKPELTEYVIEKYEKLATDKVKQEKFSEAIEIYHNIINQCGTDHDNNIYKLKVYECMLQNGQDVNVISNVDNFINDNNSAQVSLIAEALVLKGQAYIHLGDINKAIDIFSSVATKYPGSETTANAYYLLGYCKILQDKLEEATAAFNIVMQKYGKSSFAGKAQGYLDRIKNIKN